MNTIHSASMLKNMIKATHQLLIVICLLFTQVVTYGQNCAATDGTIWVTNTNDIGAGSLRDAIDCANTTVGLNTIKFNISGTGPHTIPVGSQSGDPLPTILDAETIIDGTTQAGFGVNGFNPQIILDGQFHNWTEPINAIFIRADNCEVYGLEITNFPDDGIDVRGGDYAIIGDIGKGNVLYNNGWVQDSFPDDPTNGNSWNGCAIVLRNGSSYCQVKGNIVGTNYSFSNSDGNESAGVLVRTGSNFNEVGGALPGEANILAFNETGVRVDNSYSCLIQQNTIYCNSIAGVVLLNAANSSLQAPTISTALLSDINGQATNATSVELYLNNDSGCVNAPCQGKFYLGTASVNAGAWTFDPTTSAIPLSGGELITALAIDASNNTSDFAICTIVVDPTSCADTDGTIWVTNTNDDGVGSLRDAIKCANNTVGPNTIKFDISGVSPHQINVGSITDLALPSVDDAYTIIDATTQPGFGNGGNFSPQIILDGQYKNWTAPNNALWVRADYCEVYGLEIVNFPDDGIDFTNADYGIIGAPNKGNVIYNNGAEQDYFPDAPDTGPWNGCAVVLKSGSANCVVQGNYIGTNYSQTSTAGNESSGVLVRNGGDNNLIGGAAAGEANIIAYNEEAISIGSSSSGCRIQQNSIYCNSLLPIELLSDANSNIVAPLIGAATTSSISGQANSGIIVEVFVNDASTCTTAPCQGKTFLGTATVSGGTWILNAPFANGILLTGGESISATVTDVFNNTSPFSNCALIPASCDNFLANSTVTNATCGQSNGSATISTTGGNFPYSFDYGNGILNNPILTNLSAGNYTVTVTDGNNCTTTEDFIIGSTSSITLTVGTLFNDDCNQSGTGSFMINATGGEAPYSYDIGNGPTASSTFSNLTAGAYSVTVTDANACTAALSLGLNSNTGPTVGVFNISNTTCGQANGGFSLLVSGGSAPYTFNIGNGPTSTPSFSNLLAGVYTIVVTDANACTNEQQVVISDNGQGPSIVVSTVVNETCGNGNGSFDVTVTGGASPYAYDIGNGATTNPSFSDLSAGVYNLTVTDANDCSSSEIITITDEGAFSVSITNVMEPTCGDANGSFTVGAIGGLAPYTFDIGNGPVSNTTFDNLIGGVYEIIVTDANNCTSTESITLVFSSGPSLVIISENDATCGVANGSFTVSATGGLVPYTFDIGNGPTSNTTFDNLSAGTYTVTVRDGNACTNTEEIIINATGGVSLSVSTITEVGCDQMNGSFEVIASGGQTPYSYDIGNGSVSSGLFSNLDVGNYVVTVTDANDCTAIESIAIEGTPSPSLSVTNINDATCGQNNGTVTVEAIDGAAPYTYDIGDGPNANPTFINLTSGEYTVTVTDSNNCTATVAVAIENSGGLPEAIYAYDVDGLNVSFSNMSIGGSTYSWDFGDGNTMPTPNPSYTYSEEGTFEVCLTVNNTCGSDTHCESITVIDLSAFQITFNVESLDGVGGETILLPVTVANFTDVLGFAYSIHVDDPTVATILGVSDFAISDLAAGNFFINDDVTTVAWIDNSVAGVDLADGTVLFNLQLQLNGNPGDCTTITIDGTPTPVSVVQEIDGTEEEVPATLNVGTVCLIQANATVGASGSVYKENDVAIPNVNVECTNMPTVNTITDGSYALNDMAAGADYTLDPSSDGIYANGISVTDILAIQQHILLITPLDSPYKIIAADVNHSETVTTFDLVKIQDLVLGRVDTFPNNDSWRFVPAAHDFPDPSDPFAEPFPETITYNSLNVSVINQDFIGIKIGDINLNADVNFRPANTEELELIVADQTLIEGEEMVVDFRASDFQNIMGYQLELHFDETILDLVEVIPGVLPSLSENNFGFNFLEKGTLPTLWINPSGINEGLSVEDDAVLFSFRFETLVSGNLLSEVLSLGANRIQTEAHKFNQTLDVKLAFRNSTVSIDQLEEMDFELFQNTPNPFTEITTINFSLPQQQKAIISIFDVSGKEVYRQEKNYNQGINRVEIRMADLPSAGIYFYQVKTLDFVASKKMIVNR